MKKIIVSLIAVIAVSAAFAYPTLSGGQGGIDVQNAYVTEKNTISVTQFVNEDATWPTITMAVPLYNSAELYASYTNEGGANQEEVVSSLFSIGAKVALPVDFLGCDIAVGGNYSKAWSINELSGYVAVSRDFFGMTATVNYTYSQSESFGDSVSNEKWAFNVDKAITNKVNVGLEFTAATYDYSIVPDYFYGWESSSKARGAAYARAAFADNFAMQAAVANIGQKAKFTLGGALTF